MKKSLLLLPAMIVAVPAFALPDIESFSDATAFGGTSYTTGAFLAGQANASGQSWWELGNTVGVGAHQPTIAAGDLSVSGLYSPGGGHSALFGGNGSSARLNLSVGAGGITSGTVYFSFATKLTDLTGLNTTGNYWAGFNNVQSQNAGTGTPGTIVSRVYARSAAGGYNLGLQQGSGNAPATTWDSHTFTTSDTVFLVGSYTFNTVSSSDDLAQLWINPDSSTFGGASAPASSLSSTGGTDIARIASFMLFDHAANEPAGGLVDDVRFGQNWADVTPAVPEPSTVGLMALGAGLIGARLMMRRKKS